MYDMEESISGDLFIALVVIRPLRMIVNGNDVSSTTSVVVLQARIQRGSSCSYITAMECKIITEKSL